MRTLIGAALLFVWSQIAPPPQIRIIPPSGATFAPGQRFDLRIETADLQGIPQQLTVRINGQDRTKEILGSEQEKPAAIGSGITRRNWSLPKPGKYEISVTLTDSLGSPFSAVSTIEIRDLLPERQPAKNVILFIGDGMGIAQRTAARDLSCGIQAGRAKCWLNMDQMESYGMVSTSSLDAIVTDSSPGASAYATGNKSKNNWHGVFPDDTDLEGITLADLENNIALLPRVLDNPRVENIAELLRRTRRMATGVVSTVSVTDSTPAAFGSHTIRFVQATIAEQLLQSGLDVIMGAGSRYFVPRGDPILGNIESQRKDTRNLVDEFKRAGYSYVANDTELRAAGRADKLLGLFQASDMASRYDRIRARDGNASGKEAMGQFPDQPNLETMTQQAIAVLSKNPNGFFLMVEAGSIDRQYHMMDPGRGAFETIELDKAIGVATAWARQRGNEDTLIVVTADHETSGLAVAGFWDNSNPVYVGFPNYTDNNKDGFPDTLVSQRPLMFDFASVNIERANQPSMTNQYFDLPRNLRDLNPTSTKLLPAFPNPPSANHTGSDIVISASGPGSHLFGGVMDNTDGFFKMLRALGYKP